LCGPFLPVTAAKSSESLAFNSSRNSRTGHFPEKFYTEIHGAATSLLMCSQQGGNLSFSTGPTVAAVGGQVKALVKHAELASDELHLRGDFGFLF
jgi:hypothetical protein